MAPCPSRPVPALDRSKPTQQAYALVASEKQVPVEVKLRDGEVVSGSIEYFDERMIRLTRDGAPNLFIYKEQVRTIREFARRDEARRSAADRRIA